VPELRHLGHVKARQSVQPSGATNFPQLQVGGGRNQGKSIPVLCRPCRRVLGSHRLTVRWCPRGRRPIASKTVVVIALLGNMIDVADRRRLPLCCRPQSKERATFRSYFNVGRAMPWG
jgi:hypothetical protein